MKYILIAIALFVTGCAHKTPTDKLSNIYFKNYTIGVYFNYDI